MKKLAFICSVLMAAIFSGCSEDAAETVTTGSIAGSVSDKTTGEPVATVNVKITPGGSSTVTGSDGTFTFRNLKPDSYTLTITKEGYKQNSSTVSVRVGEPTTTHLLIERIPAVVTADREILDFGSNESTNTLSFNIVNPGYTDLEWEIEERCDWITEVKPDKGTLKYGKTEAIVVVIDRELLKSGTNEAILIVRSSNGSFDVKVTAVGAERVAPKLNTLSVTNIASESATLNGEIIHKGIPECTERGFVYSLNPEPTLENTIAKLICPVTSIDKFSYDIDGLTHNKSYYVRAYATNKDGTAYSSNEIKFTTDDYMVPALSTLSVTNITLSSATLNGEITHKGIPEYTERGFVYSLNPKPTLENTIAKLICPVTSIDKFSYNIEGLIHNMTYYVRAYAINKSGTAYSSNEIQFTTEKPLPQVTTLDVADPDISAGKATFRGNVTFAGDPPYTERGFVFSTLPEPTINDNKKVANGSGQTGTYSIFATNLPTTTYYVRAYATSPDGTVYGEQKTIESEWIEIPSRGIAVQKTDVGYGNYETVKSMCENSTLGGYTDWRLPTIDELMVLYNNREMIGGFKKVEYWSSSVDSYSYYYDSYFYYYINFNNGRKNSTNPYNSYNARAVRTLK
ncbi:MAG: carboxypeptidase regulatory-like domain-containing protein [Prevotella sp.]|nr:carboxypeptidase regulatory-like domain-containing protein [Prevotella sp.]